MRVMSVMSVMSVRVADRHTCNTAIGYRMNDVHASSAHLSCESLGELSHTTTRCAIAAIFGVAS